MTVMGTYGSGPLGRDWLGCGQISTMAKMEKYSQFDGLSAARVWCFLEDREHNIWVGTQNGLNRFRDEKITTLTRREGLLSDKSTCEIFFPSFKSTIARRRLRSHSVEVSSTSNLRPRAPAYAWHGGHTRDRQVPRRALPEY